MTVHNVFINGAEAWSRDECVDPNQVHESQVKMHAFERLTTMAVKTMKHASSPSVKGEIPGWVE